MTRAPHAACVSGAISCPGSAHCLFRVAGNWAHCSRVLTRESHEKAPQPLPDLSSAGTGQQVAA